MFVLINSKSCRPLVLNEAGLQRYKELTGIENKMPERYDENLIKVVDELGVNAFEHKDEIEINRVYVSSPHKRIAIVCSEKLHSNSLCEKLVEW